MKSLIKTAVIAGILLCGITKGAFAQDIELKGVVKEATNGVALSSAYIVLQTEDSVFVAGVGTSSDGKFAITKVKAGDYRLIISCMGYETQYISLAGLKAGISLPEILMEEESLSIDAVTVSASAVTSRIDRKLVFPTEQQVQASTNGIDLLQQLMLPRVQVNPMMNGISVPGGGEVQLRINGVKVEINEIQALLPADIIRVEYHDNPGLRYGNAEVVLDYIVRRHETGGNLGLSMLNTFDFKRFGNNGINGKINHKKSEFSANYWMNYRDFNTMWRDNEELFTLADGSTIRRKESGEPDRIKYTWHYLNVAYSYHNERRMFNATVRSYSENRPYSDYTGKIYNPDDPDNYVQMADRSREVNSRPAVDLYWQENLKNDQTLILNLVGTYNATENTRIYQESRGDLLLTDVNNIVTGNKYSWIGEGIYEKKLGDNRFGAGLRHTQAYSDNTYKNGHETLLDENQTKTGMQQGETYLYGEWKGRLKKLDYMLGAGVTRSSFRQENEGDEYSSYTFNPRLTLFYPLPGNSSVRLKSGINTHTPSLSNLSAVDQVIDSLQIQRGNPDLKPYRGYQSDLNYEWRKGIFYTNLQGTYEYLPSPIMDEKLWDNDKIIQTWNNQKSWQRMSASLNLNIGPVKDILIVSLTGGVNHYISHGNTYRHRYTNPYANIMLNGSWKNFQATFMWNTNYNRFYGETLDGGENTHALMLSYKFREMNFMLGVLNPFVNNYHTDMENWSAYASYKKRTYLNDSSRMFVFQFSYNLSFGRTFNVGGKRLNNTDEDAGVMKAGK
jgi:hypothetical protein